MENRLPSNQELNVIWRGLDKDLPDFRFKWSAKRTRTAGTIFYEERLIVLSVKHYLEFGLEEIKDTIMFCTQCGSNYSANLGDYFMINDPEHKFKCCGKTMLLGKQSTVFEETKS